MARIKLRYTHSTFLRVVNVLKGQYEQVEQHTVTNGIETAHAQTRAAATRLLRVHLYTLGQQELIDRGYMTA